MILGLEVFLTILAWRRGWKGWALIPIAAAFGFGFIMGLSGASEDSTIVLCLAADIACIIALITMTVKKRIKVQSPEPGPVNEAIGPVVDAK